MKRSFPQFLPLLVPALAAILGLPGVAGAGQAAPSAPAAPAALVAPAAQATPAVKSGVPAAAPALPAALPAAAPAAPAAQEAIDPIAAAAARDLLEAMRFKFTLAADMRAASSSAEAVLRQILAQRMATSTLDAASRAKVMASVEKVMPEAVEVLQGVFNDPQTSEDISKETARIYARLFSAEELAQITAFYKTPAGSKLLGMASRINNESLALGRRYMAPRIDHLVEKMMKSATPEQSPRKDSK